MKSCFPKRPPAFAPEVRGLGTIGVIPAASQATISSREKQPRSARMVRPSVPVTPLAYRAMLANWDRSWSTFVTSRAMIRWCLASTTARTL